MCRIIGGRDVRKLKNQKTTARTFDGELNLFQLIVSQDCFHWISRINDRFEQNQILISFRQQKPNWINFVDGIEIETHELTESASNGC